MKNNRDRHETGGRLWGVLASRRLRNTDPGTGRKLEALCSAKGVEFLPGTAAQLRDCKPEKDHCGGSGEHHSDGWDAGTSIRWSSGGGMLMT